MIEKSAGINIKRKHLSRRILFYVILCSSVLTMVTTSVQLYLEYKKDFNSIQNSLNYIETSYVPAIASSAYNLDLSQIKLQMKGALNLIGIKYIQFKESKGISEIKTFEGDPNAAKDITMTFPLEYQGNDGENIRVGELTAVANYEDIYDRLVDRIIIVFATNAVKTFCAAFIILIIIQLTITRHLKTMAMYAHGLSLNKTHGHLSLGRRNNNEPDELDEVVIAFNDMQERIQSDFETLKKAEMALRESEEKFRSIFENSPLGMVHFDKMGIVTTYNETLAKILGTTADKLIGLNTRNSIKDKKMLECLSDVQAGKKSRYEGNYLSVTGGVKKPIQASFSPIISDDGNVIGSIGIFEDVSERLEAEQKNKKLELQLQQAQKMEAIGTLAGGIAHDFNNILSIIIGNTDLVLYLTPREAPIHEHLKATQIASLRAKELVKHILDFSRKSQPEKEPVDIVVLFEEALQLVRASLPATIKINKTFRSHSCIILANPTQMNQIILNLCTNAAYAMNFEGQLDIVLEKMSIDVDEKYFMTRLTPGEYIKITVSDTGCGIKQEDMDKIFDPYFTTKGLGKGTGLGLSVVFGIVKSHDGAITVYSELDKGTAFNIFLPIFNATPEIENIQSQPLPMGHETILFVDDEEMLLDIGEMMLNALGYKTECTDNPMKALELFKTKPNFYDVVITDMTMPDMTGDTLSSELLKIRPDIPIIMCTGHSEMINGESASSLGIKNYLMKPVSMRMLAEAIRKVLDKPSS